MYPASPSTPTTSNTEPTFVQDPPPSGVHRHHFATASHGKDITIQKEFLKFQRHRLRGSLIRVSQKLQEFQPQHRHIESEAELHSTIAHSALEETCGSKVETVGCGAYGTVSVYQLRNSKPKRGSSSTTTTAIPGATTSLLSPSQEPTSCPNGSRLVAVKKFQKRPAQSTNDYHEKVLHEFNIASRLQHHNIVQTWDLVRTGTGLCLLMEFCSAGDLHSLLLSRKPNLLPVAEADCLFKQLMHGVEYLHSLKIAHCDIKPENLLLTTDGTLKITDFGCSSQLADPAAESTANSPEAELDVSIPRLTGVRGSRPYVAPEESANDDFDGLPADVWACGITYLLLRFGRMFWRRAKLVDEEYTAYIQGRREEDGYAPLETLEPADRRNIVYCMLDPQPERRITACQFLRTQWAQRIQLCSAGDSSNGRDDVE